MVHRTCATGYYSFAHELGHNQGAHHDPANASGAIYPYAYGYQEPFNSFRTVMAYNCSGGCTRVAQFSNPDVLYNGKSTGTSSNNDNSRTLNTTAATVASFRAGPGQVEPPPTPAVPPAAPGNMDATPAGASTITVNWSDRSSDESGFKVERSEDGVNFSQIASLQANSSSYRDDNLAPDTLYSYRARAWSSVGNSDYSNVASAATEVPPAYVEQLATADVATTGTRSGTYQDTWYQDGASERITERLSGKKRDKQRYGYLQHTWSFNVAPGKSTVLTAKATTNASTDSFTFAYSTDNQRWVNMFTVSDSTSGELQFFLPTGINGTMYVRVQDNVRDLSEATSYSVQVDYLMIRSENGTGEALSLPSAPTGPSANTVGQDSISISWTDASTNESGFTVERGINGTWQQAGTVDANSTSFVDSNLYAGTLYSYRVNAFNTAGKSAYSPTVGLKPRRLRRAAEQVRQSTCRPVATKYGESTTPPCPGQALTAQKSISTAMARKVTTTNNNGGYSDDIGLKGSATYSYKVCEAGTSTCSGDISVVL